MDELEVSVESRVVMEISFGIEVLFFGFVGAVEGETAVGLVELR